MLNTVWVETQYDAINNFLNGGVSLTCVAEALEQDKGEVDAVSNYFFHTPLLLLTQ